MLSQRFTEALTFATELHSLQVRKCSGIPYIAHLLGVASIALEYGASEDEAIAALLHDAIEDQGGIPTRDEIRRRFGDVVTEIVEGCTDAYTNPKPPWRERKEAYIAHILNASASVKLVSAADKLYNVRSIIKDYRADGDSVWNRFTGKKTLTLWYYESLVDAFLKTGSTPLIDELQRTVAELVKLVNNLD